MNDSLLMILTFQPSCQFWIALSLVVLTRQKMLTLQLESNCSRCTQVLSTASTTSTNTARAPKIDRPIIAASSSEEAWNTFNTKWGMFKKAYGVTGADAVQQLFHCCEVELGDAILKSNSEAVDGTESELLELIKKDGSNSCGEMRKESGTALYKAGPWWKHQRIFCKTQWENVYLRLCHGLL